LRKERRREQAYAWNIFGLMESFFGAMKRDFPQSLEEEEVSN
jgi:hypothetical protein